MTQEEIQEGNELMALYMGAKYEELVLFMQPNAGYVWNYPQGEQPDNKIEPWYKTISTLQYHKSWDWLIPVCKKVLDKLWKLSGTGPVMVDITDALKLLEIEPLFQAVVAGIQLLNEIKQKEDANK